MLYCKTFSTFLSVRLFACLYAPAKKNSNTNYWLKRSNYQLPVQHRFFLELWAQIQIRIRPSRKKPDLVPTLKEPKKIYTILCGIQKFFHAMNFFNCTLLYLSLKCSVKNIKNKTDKIVDKQKERVHYRKLPLTF